MPSLVANGPDLHDEVVEVTLDKAANVRLMDGSNFSAYRAGRNHRFHWDT